MYVPKKKVQKCWVSPRGDVIYCVDHGLEAKHIILKQYPYDEQQNREASRSFLEKKGWARFCDVIWALTGSGWVIPKHLTTDQKMKIFDLTDEWFENGKHRCIFDAYVFLFLIFI